MRNLSNNSQNTVSIHSLPISVYNFVLPERGASLFFFLDLCSGFQIPRVPFKDAFLFVSEVQFV